MAEKVQLSFKDRNPDVLTSIANLSNDEVSTPPEFANKMLDTLATNWAASNNGENIWENSQVTFLDPFTKSGVFPREITRRLVEGLAKEFPNLQERVDHILSKQVFAIGITQLTSLLARRSLYCSKTANGKYSIAKCFDNGQGNIWFERQEHEWIGGTTRVLTADKTGKPIEKIVDGKCKYCGASQREFDRDADLESHAYALIHTDKSQNLIESIFGKNMKFDVVIGNPPYQLTDGGHSASATSIYHHFVEQAKALDPRFLCMVIPARWYSGGKGVDEFRKIMINDKRIRVIEDYPDSNDVFPGTQIKGGICYFLWDRDNPGPARVHNHIGNGTFSLDRYLVEPDSAVFIRYNQALPILRKVLQKVRNDRSDSLMLPQEMQFAELVSSAKPFGLRTFVKGKNQPFPGAIKIYQNGGIGYISESEISKNQDIVQKWKVIIPALGSGSDAFPHPILGRPFVGEPGSACTETYNCIGPFASQEEATNAVSYISTKVFRFLVLMHKSSQHANRSVYTFVPKVSLDERWTDSKASQFFALSEDEEVFINSMVRPMEIESE